MRKKMWWWATVCTTVLVGWLCLHNGSEARAVGPSVRFEGARIELTREFCEALRQEGGTGSRTYSNDPRNDFLRCIAVSSEFAVKTNLTIIQQQDRIIELLEALQKQGPQQR